MVAVQTFVRTSFHYVRMYVARRNNCWWQVAVCLLFTCNGTISTPCYGSTTKQPYSFTLGRMIINILKLLPVAWSLSWIPPKKLLHLKPKTPHNSNFSVGNSIKLNVKSGYFPTIILKCIYYYILA